MGTIEQTFSLGLFTADAITRAVHRFGATHSAELFHQGEVVRVVLTPRTEPAADVQADLRDAVLDESLRESVRGQTSRLHETLLAAAFKDLRGQSA